MNTQEFAALVEGCVGDRYILGVEVAAGLLDPSAFDCSELVEWSYGMAGVKIRDLAACQYDDTVPVVGAVQVGDLVFLRNNRLRWNGIGHVAIITAPLGHGDWRIIEAKGKDYGVISTTLSYWRTKSTFAGVRRYAQFSLAVPTAPAPILTPPPPAPMPAFPPFPGRNLYLRWPRWRRMRGIDVKTWQLRMQQRGWRIDVDGVFGTQSHDVCLRFQADKGLVRDGVVGPDTWAAAWTTPVT